VFSYLLDTNALSELIRNPAGELARRVVAVGDAAVGTSIVVACELRFGAAKKGSPVLTAKVEELLANIEVSPLGDDADRHYAALRVRLERAGTPIGPNDMLIAAHALALGVTVVTDNVKEFSRVPGLAVESWLPAR
jgi:tRNA(fMet)-specific endonuclease VapC